MNAVIDLTGREWVQEGPGWGIYELRGLCMLFPCTKGSLGICCRRTAGVSQSARLGLSISGLSWFIGGWYESQEVHDGVGGVGGCWW